MRITILAQRIETLPGLRLAALLVILLSAPAFSAQDQRVKARISNAGFTITALPLLAAKEWSLFSANGLDMEVILMQSALVPAALTQGDIDFQAGVGPASVNATLSGFATRAIWFSSDKISYWLMAKPQFKSLESLKGKKEKLPHELFSAKSAEADAAGLDYLALETAPTVMYLLQTKHPNSNPI